MFGARLLLLLGTLVLSEALGQFRLGAVYVAIRASDEALVVTAARELRPR
jgi:hypothetical protein